jgi:hypothetical protein
MVVPCRLRRDRWWPEHARARSLIRLISPLHLEAPLVDGLTEVRLDAALLCRPRHGRYRGAIAGRYTRVCQRTLSCVVSTMRMEVLAGGAIGGVRRCESPASLIYLEHIIDSSS